MALTPFNTEALRQPQDGGICIRIFQIIGGWPRSLRFSVRAIPNRGAPGLALFETWEAMRSTRWAAVRLEVTITLVPTVGIPVSRDPRDTGYPALGNHRTS